MTICNLKQTSITFSPQEHVHQRNSTTASFKTQLFMYPSSPLVSSWGCLPFLPEWFRSGTSVAEENWKSDEIFVLSRDYLWFCWSITRNPVKIYQLVIDYSVFLKTSITLCKGHRTCCRLITSEGSRCNNVTRSSWSCYAWGCHFKDWKSTKHNVLTSTIFETKIRESPYVSKADGKTHQSQEKIQFWRPCLPLFDISHLESSNEVRIAVWRKSNSLRIKYPENWSGQYQLFS